MARPKNKPITGNKPKVSEAVIELLNTTLSDILGVDQQKIGNSLKDELTGMSAIIECLDPTDTIEINYCVQITTSYMLGMRKLESGYPADQKLGLKLLGLGNQVLQLLSKRRLLNADNRS